MGKRPEMNDQREETVSDYEQTQDELPVELPVGGVQ